MDNFVWPFSKQWRIEREIPMSWSTDLNWLLTPLLRTTFEVLTIWELLADYRTKFAISRDGRRPSKLTASTKDWCKADLSITYLSEPRQMFYLLDAIHVFYAHASRTISIRRCLTHCLFPIWSRRMQRRNQESQDQNGQTNELVVLARSWTTNAHWASRV